MKKVKPLILVLAVLMLLQMFCACARHGDGETTTTDESGTTDVQTTADETDKNVDAKGFVKDALPSDLNFGKPVTILCWNSERPEFESAVEGQTGDNIMDAIWGRNIAVQERLGVTLEFQKEIGEWNHRDQFMKKVENAYTSGTYTYDIIAAYSRTAGLMASKGLYVDLNSVNDSYIDFEKPWWPAAFADGVGIGNSLYFLSGDISTNLLHFMYGIYYNKQMLRDLGLPDPASEYAEQKKWTIDRLIEMSKNLYQDLDKDGSRSFGDQYGFVSFYYHIDAFYTGSGLKLVENTKDERLLKISPDYSSQKAINLVDKLGKWLTTDDCFSPATWGELPKDNEETIFAEGRGLFALNRVNIADKSCFCKLNDVDWSYGLIPTPLYDESQKDYITVIGNPFTLYGIMATAPDPVMATAVIECLASEAYRRTSPEIFEINMKYKYTQENISAKMFDILRRTSVTDLGRIYASALGPIMSEIPSTAACQGNSWATLLKKYSKPLSIQMKLLTDGFREKK